MKYKDYYAALGVERSATADQIKAAYRKLARKYHPDVSKEKDAEEKFKEVAEAYETLKDPEKRAAYDQLGRHAPGDEFRPPPDWQQSFGETQFSFDDLDLADLFANLSGRSRGGGRRASNAPRPGQDFEAAVHLTFEQAFSGTEIEFDMAVPEPDENGFLRRVPRKIKVRVPKGVTDGQKLRVPGKGGKGVNGGRDGDLYLDIEVDDASALPRRGPRPVHGPPARALGSGARRERRSAHAVRPHFAEGARGYACGPEAAARRTRRVAARRHVRSPVRGGADRRADGHR